MLLGLAVFRGFAHARLPLAESTITHLLALGIPGLAAASLIGGLISEPYRTRFLADALSASILFIGATVLALAFTRLAAMATDEELDWRRNPAWLALALVMLIGAIVAAVPLAGVAGTLISILFGVALGPLFILGLITGLDRTGRRILAGLGLVALVLIFRSFLGPVGTVTIPTPAEPPSQPANETADQVLGMGLGGLLAMAAIAAILVLTAIWLRRGRAVPDDLVHETRSIDRGDGGLPVRRARRRFGRRREPTNAVEAYVALVAELDREPGTRRERGETPAEHAARIRASGAVSLPLDLLAADYALARFGDVRLTDLEDRRAVRRWRTLRRQLARGAPPPAG